MEIIFSWTKNSSKWKLQTVMRRCIISSSKFMSDIVAFVLQVVKEVDKRYSFLFCFDFFLLRLGGKFEMIPVLSSAIYYLQTFYGYYTPSKTHNVLQPISLWFPYLKSLTIFPTSALHAYVSNNIWQNIQFLKIHSTIKYSTAFDRFCYGGLLYKLKGYATSGQFLKWLNRIAKWKLS